MVAHAGLSIVGEDSVGQGTVASILSGGQRRSLLPWVREERRREWADVAVLLPCRNEEVTIAKVVEDFADALPHATIYVYDNASTDGTAAEAARAGAIVRRSPAPGKGNVMRRMFAEIDADVYVLADGDDTYDASAAPALIRRMSSSAPDPHDEPTGSPPRQHEPNSRSTFVTAPLDPDQADLVGFADTRSTTAHPTGGMLGADGIVPLLSVRWRRCDLAVGT
jgi:Glycosyl transferase family 2